MSGSGSSQDADMRREVNAMKKLYAVCLALFLFLLTNSPSYAQAPAELKLPEGTIKISDAIPAMGEHWANPRDLPLGPIYLVWQGKVIGVEYMFTLAMMNAAPAGPPSPTGEVAYNYQTPDLALPGQKVDHLTLDYMPEGHPGFKVPHYDIHMYFISPADRYKIILNIPPPPAVSPSAAGPKPATALKTSDIVPRVGAHWSDPVNRPFGPIYIEDNAGKEVGIEFTYNHDKMQTRRVVQEPGGPLVWECSIDHVPVGRVLNHMWVTYLPRGRGEDRAWRFEFHLYSITPEERVKILPAAPTGAAPAPAARVFDPARETVLIGRNLAGDMIVQLEIEPAKSMWMQMGTPPVWMEKAATSAEPYHVEVKPVDPVSGARISFAEVIFTAINRDNGRKMEGMLHPMWGSSGLHYAINHALAGDGTYEATVMVGVPAFSRDLELKNRWMKSTTATFSFRLAGGKLTDISTPTIALPASKEAVKAPGTRAELPGDPAKKTVFIGSVQSGGMIVQLELEPAEAMLMQMGTPPMWMEKAATATEPYHVEVTVADPASGTGISFTRVMLSATNRDNGRKVEGMLHPMWGDSGLHYAMNSGLAGDGTYEATITVEPPTFTRSVKDLWMEPVKTTFTFKLAGGQVTEVGR